MALTPLPTPSPSRADPVNFNARAEALLGALPTMVTEINIALTEMTTARTAFANEAATTRTNAITAITDSRTQAVNAISAASSAGLQSISQALSTVQPLVNTVLSAHEAAVNLPSTGGESTSSLTIGLGNKSFVTQTDKNWRPGQYVNIAYAFNASQTIMSGIVLSYNENNGDMTVAVEDFTGSGTYNSWILSLGARARLLPVRVLITTDTTAITGVEYVFMAACSLTLPATGVVYFNNLSGTLNCYLKRPSGGKIESLAEDMRLDDLRASGSITYIDATKGWCLQ